MNKEYNIGTKVIMKKQHPCGTNLFEVVRTGVDIKIKCVNCGRIEDCIQYGSLFYLV